MASNERIRRGEGELEAREPMTNPIASDQLVTPNPTKRLTMPPPPAISLRPPTSWLKGR